MSHITHFYSYQNLDLYYNLMCFSNTLNLILYALLNAEIGFIQIVSDPSVWLQIQLKRNSTFVTF